MEKLARFVVGRSRLVIFLILAITIFLGYSATRLVIMDDVLEYLPEGEPETTFFKELGRRFGGTQMVVVALETPEGHTVFEPETLEKIRDLTTAFKRMKEVSLVISLTNVIDIRGAEGEVQVSRLIDPKKIPPKEELAKIRDYTLGKDLYVGQLVSADGRFTGILIRLFQDVNNKIVAGKIRQLAVARAGPENVYVAGAPAFSDYTGEYMEQDLSKLIPLVILCVMLTLFLSFRTLRGTLLPLAAVLISTTWTMGIMALCGKRLTMIAEAIPVILIAIGSAYGIHMLNKINEGAGAEENKKQDIVRAVSEVGVPIILAALTTMIGFGSLITSKLVPIRDFGVFTAVGVAAALLVAVVFIPAVAANLKVRKIEYRTANRRALSVAFLDFLAGLVNRRRALVIVLFGVAGFAALLSVPGLIWESNMSKNFADDSEPRLAEKAVIRNFGGALYVQVDVQGDIKDPAVLKEMQKIQEYMEGMPEVQDPRSVVDLVSQLNKVMNTPYRIPQTRDQVTDLWFFIEGDDMLEQLVNHNATEAIIQGKIGDLDTGLVTRIVDRINGFIDREVDQSLVYVDLDRLPAGPEGEALGRRVREASLDRITDRTLRLAHLTEKGRSHVKRIIRQELERRDDILSPKLRKALEDRVVQYFLGGESEIVVGNEETARSVAEGFADLVSKGRTDAASMTGLIRDRIPARFIGEDEYLVDDMALSFSLMAERYLARARAENAMDRILAASGYEPDKFERRDLFGALVEMGDHVFPVPVSMLGGAAPHYAGAKRIPAEFKLTGYPVVFQVMDRQLKVSQMKSMAMSLGLVLLVLILQLWSVSRGVLALLPILVTIVLNFLVMALLKIPMDVATTMITSVAIGIGIDYSIHYVSRFRREMAISDDPAEAVRTTHETTGKAILFNALAVMAGFGVLLLCSLVPMQRFGLLTALTMVWSALGAVLLLPALLSWVNRKAGRGGGGEDDETERAAA